uniref:Uncharacterized protein n=1 Tax=Anguilla anguilla TaxID=7936 RepID=A0A0E9W9X1_ANGAN
MEGWMDIWQRFESMQHKFVPLIVLWEYHVLNPILGYESHCGLTHVSCPCCGVATRTQLG